MAFLELRNVSKGYGPQDNRTEVLRSITLQIEKGEFVAIVGYSGAGNMVPDFPLINKSYNQSYSGNDL